jgi:hypothetical protein
MPTWLTIKASLYAGAVLLLLLAAQTVRLHIAQADVKAAKADVTTANTQRDAAAVRAQDADKASKGWQNVAEDRLALLKLAQAENTRLNEANAAAADAARLAADKANNDLTAWRRKYRALLSSDNCTRAQAALEAACSVESY